MIETVDPANGQKLQQYPFVSAEMLESTLEKSFAAFENWRQLTVIERSKKLTALSAEIAAKKQECARLMTVEMGKPLRQSVAEIEKVLWLIESICEYGPGWLQPQELTGEGKSNEMRHEPLGPIVGIMPWNFPFWQTFRFAIPTLLAGNSVILKQAPETTGCGQLIQEIFDRANLNSGLYQTLVCSHEQVASMIADQRVRGLSLTGCVNAGKAVAAQMGSR